MGNTAVKNGEKKLPPMLQQYVEYKERYPDCELFFQVGDFYELFFEDAVRVAGALNLTLTSRDKNSDNPVPMCGVPCAVIDGYIDRIVDAGFSAAIVSQVGSTPAKGGPAKGGMVERRLERIVTPGVRLLGGESAMETEHVVVALYPSSDQEISLAFSDVKTGTIWVREGIALNELQEELLRIGEAEYVLPKKVSGKSVDRRTPWVKIVERLQSSSSLKFRDYGVDDISRRDYTSIDGYSSQSGPVQSACRLFIQYIDEVTVSSSVQLTSVQKRDYEHVMGIDAIARRNLDLTENARDGSKRGTLLSVFDETVTSGGARFLKSQILGPLLRKESIDERLDAVETLRGDFVKLDWVRDRLRRIPDLERIAARVDLGIVTPRELDLVRQAYDVIPHIATRIREERPSLLASIAEKLAISEELYDLLKSSIVDEPPAVLNQGGYIRSEYDEKLAHFRELRANGADWFRAYEAELREKSDIQSLKVKFNNVLGYFIEVTKPNLPKIPESFVQRQTTTNAARFFTDELKEQEKDFLSAKDAQIEREALLYKEIVESTKRFAVEFRRLFQELSYLDFLCSLALVAHRDELTRPQVDESELMEIVEGKHPVLANSLGSQFVSNSLSFTEAESVMLITGPNMGGKSTYLRQAALLSILAQIGSYVPARSAKIGIVDQIFARIGASDDQSEGDSTFMVEMRETSHILRKATARSLILFDEIGRGTATADGYALAQSILEWVNDKLGCRTLFATHYHELTLVAEERRGIRNLSVGALESEGEVLFTHKITEGPARASYGIEVARMAGLPDELVQQARDLLANLPTTTANKQLSMFSSASTRNGQKQNAESEPPTPKVDPRYFEVVRELQGCDINNLTPIEALTRLAALRRQADECND